MVAATGRGRRRRCSRVVAGQSTAGWLTWASAAVRGGVAGRRDPESRRADRFGARATPTSSSASARCCSRSGTRSRRSRSPTAGAPDHKLDLHRRRRRDPDVVGRRSPHDNYQAPRRIPEVRVAALVYALRNAGPALIIGPGGGHRRHLGAAPRRAAGGRRRGEPDHRRRGHEGRTYAGWNGDLYRDPRVHVRRRRGPQLHPPLRREPTRRSRRPWSTPGRPRRRARSRCRENNIYTREAFSEFLDHLAPGGVLTVTRWYDAGAPKEFLRLVALGRAALEARGVPGTEVARYFAIADRQPAPAARCCCRAIRISDGRSGDVCGRRRPTAGSSCCSRPAVAPPAQGGDEDGLLHTLPGRASTSDVVLAAQRYDARADHRRSPVLLLHRARRRPAARLLGRAGPAGDATTSAWPSCSSC